MSNTEDEYSEITSLYQELHQTRREISTWFRQNMNLMYRGAEVSSRIQTSGGRACWIEVVLRNGLFRGETVKFKASDYLEDSRIFHEEFVKLLEQMNLPALDAPYAGTEFHERLLNESIKVTMRNQFLLYKNRIKGEPEWVDEMKKNLDNLIVERVSKA